LVNVLLRAVPPDHERSVAGQRDACHPPHPIACVHATQHCGICSDMSPNEVLYFTKRTGKARLGFLPSAQDAPDDTRDARCRPQNRHGRCQML